MKFAVGEQARRLAWLVAGMVFLFLAAPAQSAQQGRVYADEAGNLIIESASGYKEIIIGGGSKILSAERLKAVTSTDKDQGHRVYRDSRGNLVVESSTPIKRVVITRDEQEVNASDDVAPLTRASGGKNKRRGAAR